MSPGAASEARDIHLKQIDKLCGGRKGYEPPSVQVRVLKSVEHLVREAAGIAGLRPSRVRNAAILIGLVLLAAGLAKPPRREPELEALLARARSLIERDGNTV